MLAKTNFSKQHTTVKFMVLVKVIKKLVDNAIARVSRRIFFHKCFNLNRHT